MAKLVNEFSNLFSEPDKVIFCSYLNLGLICLDGIDNKLTLVSTVASTDGNPTAAFGKISTISLCPVPPKTCEFQQILPNKNGSKLALIGLRMVLVVDMNESFWMNASLLNTGNISNLKPEYFSRCQILHMSLVVSKSPPSIVKVNWYLKSNTSQTSVDHSTTTVRRNLLAVLFSDSVLRFYDVKNCMERAIFIADFRPLLSDSAPDPEERSFHNGFALGILSQIVAFDFGPTVSYDDRDATAVFAMDADGGLYFCAFTWSDLKCFAPVGPLAISNNNSNGKFVCAGSDLIYVLHSRSSIIPVFAMASNEGVISHVVLVQRDSSDILLKNGKNIFDLFIFDSLQLENWSSSNISLKLQNDSSDKASYFAVNANNLYVVDISEWTADIMKKISSDGFVLYSFA